MIVLLYKKKREGECGRGITSFCKLSFKSCSLPSVVRKVNGRILIERVRGRTDRMIGKEQSGFRIGQGCIHKVFVLIKVAEKAR